MSGRLERDVHNIERGAEALLREHPDALVCGLADEGLIVPVPQSVGLWGQGAIEGRAVTDVVIAEDRMIVVDAWRVVQTDGVAEGRVRLLSKPSSWATLCLWDLRELHGVFLGILLPALQEPASASDGEAEHLEALSRCCSIMQDQGGVVVDIEDAYTEIFGYIAEDVIGKPVLEQIHPEDQALTVERWIAMLSTRRAQQLRVRRRHKDGHYIGVDITLRNFLNQPDRNYVAVEMIDVSAEMAAFGELQEKSALLERLIESTADGLLQVDGERNIVYCNARLLEILDGGGNSSRATEVALAAAAKGSAASSLLARTVSDDGIASFNVVLERALEDGSDRDVEVDVALRTGGWRRVLMRILVVCLAEDVISGALISVSDANDPGRPRRELETRTRVDALTRCQSRASILEAVQRELERHEGTSTGVVYIDLEDLRSVNDTLGDSAGDELLILVAERLRAASREGDEIGRLGGDEFLVLLPEIPTPDLARSVARRIEAALCAKADLSCGTVALTASVGVAWSTGEPISARTLIERAEHGAKRQHRAHLKPEPRRPRLGLPRLHRRRHRDPGSTSHTSVRRRRALGRQETERLLTQHTRQHDAVANLGQLALREHDQELLFDEVATTVARTLEVELCTMLKLREDDQLLDVVASIGYNHGPSALPASHDTQAGYALSTRAPVVAEDLRAETRFDSQLLLEQGMLSGMSAVIEGRERPFGVLSVHTSARRQFSRDDVNFLVAIVNVISAAVERDRKEDSAKHAALHDSLTGLPNRTLALDRVDRALARRRRDGTECSVLVLDVDRFKLINDSLGHDAGDAVLLALVARFEETLRASDTIARLGGDEFLIVSEHAGGPRYAAQLAERIGAAMRKPLTTASGEHHLSASVGIAVAGEDDEGAVALLRDADAAMHRAKEEGRGRYELFDETLRARVVSRLRTENELRAAIDREQLEIHYQPIMELDSGQPVAAEALVRWQHPEHGLVPPLEFIPIAEETGLIGALGRYVLERASAQGAAWQKRYGKPLKMYINVSGFQLADVRFAAQAVEIARRSGLMPETLGLEVTESVLIAEGRSSIDVLGELDAHGLPLVLDDFGTGYSSLSYLRRFPLSSVKVDRSFIDGLGSSEQDAAIMKAIIEMCRALDLTVVGEGVETLAQLQQLRELGCDHVQGYLFCHPMPVQEASEFLDRRFGPPALRPAA